MKTEDGKRVKTGGRQLGSPNVLPDLRAITLKALMKAGGVDYLVHQANENPMGFLSLLGRVMPRESHVELTGELKVRQEVRRDLVEKLVILMRPDPIAGDAGDAAIEGTATPLPAITHNPDAMLKAQKMVERDTLTRRTESARAEGAVLARGITERAAAMHTERAKASQERMKTRDYVQEANDRIDGLKTTEDFRPTLDRSQNGLRDPKAGDRTDDPRGNGESQTVDGGDSQTVDGDGVRTGGPPRPVPAHGGAGARLNVMRR